MSLRQQGDHCVILPPPQQQQQDQRFSSNSKSCSCRKRRCCNRFAAHTHHWKAAWPLLIVLAVSMLAVSPITVAHVLKRSTNETKDIVIAEVEYTTVTTPQLEGEGNTLTNHTISAENKTIITQNSETIKTSPSNETIALETSNHDENNEIPTVDDDDNVKDTKSSVEFSESKLELEDSLLTENLEESIRNAVKNQIEIEHNIGASAVERLQDIPEAEVRQKLTEEILANKSPSPSYITESTTIRVKTETDNVAEQKLYAASSLHVAESTNIDDAQYLNADENFNKHFPQLVEYKAMLEKKAENRTMSGAENELNDEKHKKVIEGILGNGPHLNEDDAFSSQNMIASNELPNEKQYEDGGTEQVHAHEKEEKVTVETQEKGEEIPQENDSEKAFEKHIPTILDLKGPLHEKQREAEDNDTKSEVNLELEKKMEENLRGGRNIITQSAVENILTEENMQKLEENVVVESAEPNTSSSSSSSASNSSESTSEESVQEEKQLKSEDSNMADENIENSLETAKSGEHTIREHILSAALSEDIMDSIAASAKRSDMNLSGADNEALSIVLKENLTATESAVSTAIEGDQLEDLIHLEETLNESHEKITTILPEIEKIVHVVIKKPGVELDGNNVELEPQDTSEQNLTKETIRINSNAAEEQASTVVMQPTVKTTTPQNSEGEVDNNEREELAENDTDEATLQPQENSAVEEEPDNPSDAAGNPSKNAYEIQKEDETIEEEPVISSDVAVSVSKNSDETQETAQTTIEPLHQENDESTKKSSEQHTDLQSTSARTVGKVDEVRLSRADIAEDSSDYIDKISTSTTDLSPTTTMKEFEAYEDEGDHQSDIVPELMSSDGSDVTASTKGSRSINIQTHHTTSQMDASASATLSELFPPHAAGQTFSDNLAAENHGHLGSVSPATSLSEGLILSKSGVIVVFSGVALVCLTVSVIVFLIIFQRTHGTLDIEMQEQRCGKDDSDEDDDEDADTCTKLLEIELPKSSIAFSAEETDECL